MIAVYGVSRIEPVVPDRMGVHPGVMLEVRRNVRQEHRTPVDALLLIERDGQILLTRRAGDIYGSGWWAIPSGRLEPDEDIVTAAVREADEELGIQVDEDDALFVGVTHARPPDSEPRIGFGFLISRWHGEPAIREPDKCTDLLWRRPDDLPDPTMPYSREIIRLHIQRQPFSRPGWRC